MSTVKKGNQAPIIHEQAPEDFEFENRSSIVVGQPNVRQPGGDTQEMLFDDNESLTSGLDNLADCFEGLEVNDDFSMKQKEF